MSQVEVALELDAGLGESPVWDVDRQILHLVDIFARKIHQFDVASGTVKSIAIEGVPGALALRRDGGYIGGIDLNFATIEPDGAVTPIAMVSVGDRMNDGKCDPRGRFIAGTMDNQQRRGAAALYQLEVDGTVRQLLSDVTLSNGLDWNLTGDRFYHTDTTLERINVYDYDLDTGQLGEGQVFADLKDAPGRPDGLTVDAEGGLWVAVARAGRVHHYDRRGRLTEVIEFPTPMVTSCAFGGSNLDRLYVTSSRALLAEPQRAHDPLAGSVFVVEDLRVQGQPPHRYGA